MNLIRDSLASFTLIFLQCLSISLATGSGFGSCTSSSFSRSIGYILRGFLLGEVNVADMMECKKRCIISANCLSVNILTNADGGLVCQLNSGRKEDGVSEQFVQHGAGEYYGLKNKKLCNNEGQMCDNVSPWFAFNQSYFQYVRIGSSHFEARAYCEEQNSMLASISSEEEQTFLYETFIQPDPGATGAVRIGMNDIEELGVYVWEDGSDVTHIRWAPGDPNNSGGSERCIGMMRTNGGFFVILCDGPYKDFLFCETNYDSIYS